MKRKICAFLLALTMVLTSVPAAFAVSARSGAPGGFSQAVTLPLPGAISSGLMEDADLPEPGGSGFLAEAEGWTPVLLSGSLPAAVSEPEAGAVEISSPEELQAMETGGSYVLTADINLTDYLKENGWNPIAIKGSVTLDGQGHAIRGFSLTSTTTVTTGLFSTVGGTLTVKNLRWEDASLTLDYNSTSGSVYGVGTLAGKVGALVLENFTASNVTVTRSYTSRRVGGIVGWVGNALTAENCSLDVTMTRMAGLEGEETVEILGGLAGLVGGDALTLSSLYARVNVNAEEAADSDTGGLVGYISAIGVRLKDVMVTGSVAAADGNCGGLLGKMSRQKSTLTAENCAITADLRGSGSVGGLVGLSGYPAATVTDCRYSGAITLTEGGEACAAGGLVGKCTYGSLAMEGCAAEATFLHVPADSANPTLAGYFGGLLGYATGIDYYRLTRCAALTIADGLAGAGVTVGGLVGLDRSGSHRLQDCLAELSAVGVAASSTLTIAGLTGYTQSCVISNCGANVTVSAATTVGMVPARLGGLVGGTYQGVKFAQCYSAGSMTLNYTGKASSSTNLSVGGLLGDSYTNADNSFGQCYGGTDVTLHFTDGLFGSEIGTIAGEGQNVVMYSTWSDAAVRVTTGGEVTGTGSSAGGLVGYGKGTVMDCCFIGTISAPDAYAQGGLIGHSGTLKLVNCYAETDLNGSRFAAGLVGRGGKLSAYDCRFSGSVEGEAEEAAGLACNLESGSSVYRCEVYAVVEAQDGIVGGLVSSGNQIRTVQDCSFYGWLEGRYVGGIVGEDYSASIYDCTVEGTLTLSVSEDSSGACGVGGIAYAARRVEDCHMLSSISIRAYSDGKGGSYGGILAKSYSRGSVIRNCTSKGVSYYNSGIPGSAVYVGGIAAGAGNFIVEGCKVKGSVSARAKEGSLRVGGVTAYHQEGSVQGCSVSGSVSGFLSPDEDGTAGTIYAGGITGHGSSKLYLSASYHAGSVSAWSSHEKTSIRTDDPLVGLGDYQWGGSSAGSAGRAEETYTFVTYWYEEMTTAMFPLSGATVTVDGKTVGTTGEDGTLTIDGDTVSAQSLVKVEGSCSGYFSADRLTWLADGGVVSLYLCKKTPGKIYLQSAKLEWKEGETKELLYNSANRYNLAQTETNDRELTITVDWNDTAEEGRKLVLTNEDGSRTLEVTAGNPLPVCIPSVFRPGEDIYLKATALDSAGNPVEARQKLALRVTPLKVSLPTPASSADFGGSTGVYILEDVGMKLDFGDLVKCGADVRYENGVIKVDFDTELDSSEPFTIGLFNDSKTNVVFTGKLEIPYSDIYQGQWSGLLGVTVGGKLAEKDEGGTIGVTEAEPLLVYKYTTWIGSFPVLFSTELGASASGLVGFEGTYYEPAFQGELSGEGTFSVAIGPGLAYGEDVEISLTGNGTMKLTLPVKYHGSNPENPVTFEPALEGWLSAVATVKAFDLFGEDGGWKGELKLGGFTWDTQNGVKWYALEDLTPIPLSRAYLAAGGGFSTLAWAGNPETAGLLYENILIDSRAALSAADGTEVLWFTADDGADGSSGTAGEHTALYKSVRQADGSWSTPVCVSGSGNGYPAMPSADGAYAVWINSTDTGSLEGMLSSTDLWVSMPDGTVSVLAEGGGEYLYAPKVAVNEDGSCALVTWLSAAPSILPEDPAVHYAYYDGSKWSFGVMDTEGHTVTGAAPEWADGAARVGWQTNGGVLMAGKPGGTSAALVSDVTGTAVNGGYTAAMTADGILTVWKDGDLEHALATGGSQLSNLLLLDDENGGYYTVWSETDGIYYADSASGWICAKLLCETEGMADRMTGVVTDGLPLVSYYLADANGALHLYTAQAPSRAGVDLALGTVTVDAADLADTGLAALESTVVNLREDTAAGYVCTVTDETGTVYGTYTTTSAALDCGTSTGVRAIFAPDLSAAHTYTLTVTPVDADGNALIDQDLSNNAASVIPEAAVEIVSAHFRTDLSGAAGMEIFVGNLGAAPADAVTVEVFRIGSSGEAEGEPVISRTFADVSPNSYRQVLLDGISPNTYYQVVLAAGGETVDSTMLMWQDDGVTDIWISGAELSADGSASVRLTALNWVEPVQVHVAVYEADTGRMAAHRVELLDSWSGMRTVDLNFSGLLGGEYTYRVFLLKQGSLVPACEAFTGSVTIP